LQFLLRKHGLLILTYLDILPYLLDFCYFGFGLLFLTLLYQLPLIYYFVPYLDIEFLKPFLVGLDTGVNVRNCQHQGVQGFLFFDFFFFGLGGQLGGG
jgi:hypothetical protein